MYGARTCSLGVAKVKMVAQSCLRTSVVNLHSVRTKMYGARTCSLGVKMVAQSYLQTSVVNLYSVRTKTYDASTCSLGVAKVKTVALSCLQTSVLNLYNVRTKVLCDKNKTAFKSDHEMPLHTVFDTISFSHNLDERLSHIFDEGDESRKELLKLANEMLTDTSVKGLMDHLFCLFDLCRDLISKWVGNEEKYRLMVGVLPTDPITQDGTGLQTVVDTELNRLYVHWSREHLGHKFVHVVQHMLKEIRQDGRQPTPAEYFATHLAYLDLTQGGWSVHSDALPLGTPGFRPHTQTYMALTDPGDGHLLGTTRFSDWMKGAIVHVEHLERPKNALGKIEPYRIPSIIDLAKVRLHVGGSAPTTYLMGRAVKDSGNFETDFLKVVHLTAAAASAAFYLGVAECKISMEGLSTKQAEGYMKALRAEVQRARDQSFSAAWNLNQTLRDDYDDKEAKQLTSKIEIARRAIEITAKGGFDKVTWDGASNEYPSKCIMGQLTHREALIIVHEAHLKGLVTYFSAGFKIENIGSAVLAGVDGVGIGGAQVLRYMDPETKMHGPYMEERIPEILNKRDEVARSLLGRGVHLLARLATMRFEGSLSRPEDALRQQLFKALIDKMDKMDEKDKKVEMDVSDVEVLINSLQRVWHLPDEGNMPYLHRARRLMDCDQPMLKEFCDEEEWKRLVRLLMSLISARDEVNIMEEYDSSPWQYSRKKYQRSQGLEE